jgi:hypothetical protein
MTAAWGLGLGLGIRHALESDHVAAVSTMVVGSKQPGHAARVGVAWGIGHGTAVLVAGAVILGMGIHVPARWAAFLELIVVAMLLWLGWKTWNQTVHSVPKTEHQHPPSARTPWQSMMVGLVHGISGTATLTLLLLTTMQSWWEGVGYLLWFAVGSTLSMVVFSWLMIVSLGWLSSRYSTSFKWFSRLASGVSLVAASVILWRVWPELVPLKRSRMLKYSTLGSLVLNDLFT